MGGWRGGGVYYSQNKIYKREIIIIIDTNLLQINHTAYVPPTTYINNYMYFVILLLQPNTPNTKVSQQIIKPMISQNSFLENRINLLILTFFHWWCIVIIFLIDNSWQLLLPINESDINENWKISKTTIPLYIYISPPLVFSKKIKIKTS